MDVLIEVEEIIMVTSEEEDSDGEDQVLRDINTGSVLKKVVSADRLRKKKGEDGSFTSSKKKKSRRKSALISPNSSERTLSPP